MSERVTILDHGYLEEVETWGSDEAIICAARMSTGKGFLGWGHMLCKACGFKQDSVDGVFCHGCGSQHLETVVGDEKLLTYLWTNKHATPFEMAGLTLEVQAPIFVFREWHRHRVPFGYNEMSSRYTPLPNVNYIPSIERLMVGSDGKNKQAGTIKDADVLTVRAAEAFRSCLKDSYAESEALYQAALKDGVPKELARIHLPVGRYSRMRATANLRGWLGFLTLRMSLKAQEEIRVYANAVGDLIAKRFPRTWSLFTGTST